MCDDLPTLRSLDELAELVGDRRDVYLRWSRGPQYDSEAASRDQLTGVPLPGLSANPLAVEDWWSGRSPRLWVARRLYDYRHLEHKRGPDTRPWVVSGVECGRGPDNEPLIGDFTAVAEVGMEVIEQAQNEVDQLGDDWGTLDRT